MCSFKKLLLAGVFCLCLMLAVIWYCNYVIGKCGGLCYDDLETLPPRKVGLVLGAAKISRRGTENMYFKARVESAAALYHAGKIRHILISGDNSRKDYDEPTDMMEELKKKGVPAEAMTLDYAGFRTLDSVVRAKAVFCCTELTVISQRFHVERAIYIASKHGIDAIGFSAPEPEIVWLRERNRGREKFARVAAWLDVNILNRSPKFFGEKIPLEIRPETEEQERF